jgi:hypothetical protein
MPRSGKPRKKKKSEKKCRIRAGAVSIMPAIAALLVALI